MKFFYKNKKGFTLLEILLVVATLSILAGIVVLSINPGKQIAETKNLNRRADINTILTVIYQYLIQEGSLPATITDKSTEICLTGTADNSDCVDLSILTDDATYLVEMPQDPNNESTTGTGYNIFKTANGRVNVSAPLAEEGAVISVTR